MASRRGREGGDDWTLDRVLQTFPRLGERMSNQGTSCPRRAADAAIGRALMTQPE